MKQLHLSEVALALVVFDSRSETDPFAGVDYWDRALRQARRIQGGIEPPIKKLLVAARIDRGGVSVSRARVDSVIRDLGFEGFFETSAKEGHKVRELKKAIREAIDWEYLPQVTSTELFQRIKTFLVEQREVGCVLSLEEDLYRTFLMTSHASPGTTELRTQFRTCIGRAESVGLIQRLTFGNLVLLQPALLDAYASAMVDVARSEPDGMGSILEEDARAGRFEIPRDERMKDRQEEKLVLIATVEDLLRHEIAIREDTDAGPLLVFPSQFTRENPDLPDPEGKSVIFAFEGPILSVYTTLAVRVSQSGIFRKKDMWKNAATYEATVGGICGVFLHQTDEARGELTLFLTIVPVSKRAFSSKSTSEFISNAEHCRTPSTAVEYSSADHVGRR
jgi:hypothetical protein